VLVVDDEPVVRDAVRRVLEDAGLRVAVERSGEDALASEALDGCRLVICDVMLPGMSGIELVAAIRVRDPHLPVITMTGYATADVEAQSRRVGATTFLAKPFDQDELLDLVRRVLERTDVAGKEGRP
jgi:DNA-binding NtrC family response regulator